MADKDVAFVIGQKGVRRFIRGDFVLIGAWDDLRNLAQEILRQTDHRDFSYGVIELRLSRPEIDTGPTSTAPLEWDSFERGKY